MSAIARNKLAVWGGLVVLIISGLFIRLGFWQLDRAALKGETFTHYSRNVALSEVDLSDLLNSTGRDPLWRRVRASGEYLQGADVVLDNQSLNGRPGYLVYTPMRLATGAEVIVLVNRGWMAFDGDRNVVDLPAIADARQTISAQIGKPPATGIRLAGDDSIEILPGDVRRVQTLDYAALGRAIGVTLQPLVLLLDPQAPDGFARAWSVPGSDENRHRSYAVQWFAMAAALISIYFILLLKSRR